MKRQLLSLCLLFPLTLYGQHLQLSNDNCNISYLTMEDGLLHNYIDDIYKDSRGFIWFSTGGGLSRYDGFSFTNYHMGTSPVTLKGNFVHRVFEDNFSRLWIASDRGLDILDLENLQLIDLFETADPEMKTFLKNPVKNIIKDNKGDIWFLSGHIYKIDFNQQGEVSGVFELPENLHSARYMNLAPGNYTFEVKYVPRNQTDQGEITVLQIYIKPYFYKTTWFALVVLALLISAFLLWYIRHIKSYELQQKLLRQIVEERTCELELQKETLEQQKTELSQQNLILSRQNEKVTHQKNQLIRMSQKVHRINVDKLEFFTNISQEMDEESNDKKFMDRVLEVMRENYPNPDFSAGDFVQAMGVSKSLLNNKLNALSGRSSGEFIRIYRLNIAYSQILQNKRTKNKNISDIAYDVGFNDPKYFTRCFSRHFNMTPSRLIDSDEDES